MPIGAAKGAGGGGGQPSAFFDGASVLALGSDWAGRTAGPRLSISFFVNVPVQMALAQTIVLRNDQTMNLQVFNPNSLSAGIISASFYGAGGGTEAQVSTTPGTAFPYGVWAHICLGFDLTNAASPHIRINAASAGPDSSIWLPFDAPSGATNPPSTFHLIGNDSGLTDAHPKQIAEWWEAQNQYLDFSDIANIRKFLRADGTPENVGPDGKIPTGMAPTVYLSGPGSTFSFNRGTGGGMTVVGALTAGTRPIVGEM